LPVFKKYLFFKFVPGALIAVIAGVLLNQYFANAQPNWVLNENQLVKLPVSNSFDGFLNQFTFPNFQAFANYKVYVLAFTIAIIASLETLLSTEAADKLDPNKRVTPTNLELKAQGIGNLISGLIGGLPMTAVIVRTSANINAGGKTKVSAIFHGILLLLSIAFLASILNKIPLACLAAVLLIVGYKLAKISLFKEMYKLGWEQFIPFIVTIIAIQFSDLLKGIALGMLVAIFFILRTNFKRDYEFHYDKNSETKKVKLNLLEHVTFINKGSIANKLSSLEEGAIIEINAEKSHYIDLDVLEIIYNFKDNAAYRNIQVDLVKFPERQKMSGH
jgi:MFS superfamily sulfate permease-like transporter